MHLFVVIRSMRWVLCISLLLAQCTNYDLDNKIRNGINGGSSSGTSELAVSPGSITYTLSNKGAATYTITLTGGTSPYTLVVTNHSLAPMANVTVSGNNLMLTANTAAYPSMYNTSQPTIGQIGLQVGDSSGKTIAYQMPVTVNFKKAFITAQTDSMNISSGWTTFTSCTSAGSVIQKANCACQFSASQANLSNAAKYRAWISALTPATNALCNITNNPNPSCTSVAANDGGPWYTTAGNRLSRDMSTNTYGLFHGATPLEANLDKDQFGNTAGSDAMTGTTGTGIVGGTHCTSWTNAIANCGIIGNRLSQTPVWTDNGTIASTTGRLYCFEAD